MQQLEIQYFWPLTEQVPLELDFTPSVEFDQARRAKAVQSTIGLTLTSGAGIATFSNNPFITALQIDLDQTSITVTGKPSWFRKTIFKLLGLQWKDRC